MSEFLNLSDAHVTQHTTSKRKTPWSIEANESNEKLHELPAHLTEPEVFNILHFGRKFELEAFNVGIQLGKKKTVEVYDDIIKDYKNKLGLAIAENERLATALEKHIISEE